MKRIPGLNGGSASAIIASVVLALMLSGGATAQPPTTHTGTYIPGPLQPDPTIYGTANFSAHVIANGTLAYPGGSLVGTPDATVADPVGLNTTDLVAPGFLQQDDVGGHYWQDASEWQTWQGETSSSVCVVNGRQNGQATLEVEGEGGGTYPCAPGSDIPTAAPAPALVPPTYPQVGAFLPLARSYLPNPNLALDYLTISYYVWAPVNAASCGGGVYVTNDTSPTGQGGPGVEDQTANATAYSSFTVASDMWYPTQGQVSTLTGNLFLSLVLDCTGGPGEIVVTGLAISSFPVFLGSVDSSGAYSEPTNYSAGGGGLDAQLSVLSPSWGAFGYVNGSDAYSVQVADPASDLNNYSVEDLPVQNNTEYGAVGHYNLTFAEPKSQYVSYGQWRLRDTPGVPGDQYGFVTFDNQTWTTYYRGTGTGQQVPFPPFSFSPLDPVWSGEVFYTPGQWADIQGDPSISGGGGAVNGGGAVYYIVNVIEQTLVEPVTLVSNFLVQTQQNPLVLLAVLAVGALMVIVLVSHQGGSPHKRKRSKDRSGSGPGKPKTE